MKIKLLTRVVICFLCLLHATEAYWKVYYDTFESGYVSHRTKRDIWNNEEFQANSRIFPLHREHGSIHVHVAENGHTYHAEPNNDTNQVSL